jgi:hypothetical protein
MSLVLKSAFISLLLGAFVFHRFRNFFRVLIRRRLASPLYELPGPPSKHWLWGNFKEIADAVVRSSADCAGTSLNDQPTRILVHHLRNGLKNMVQQSNMLGYLEYVIIISRKCFRDCYLLMTGFLLCRCLSYVHLMPRPFLTYSVIRIFIRNRV